MGRSRSRKMASSSRKRQRATSTYSTDSADTESVTGSGLLTTGVSSEQGYDVQPARQYGMEDLRTKVGALRMVEESLQESVQDEDYQFTTEIKAALEGFTSDGIDKFLDGQAARQSFLKEFFAFDGAHAVTTSCERLKALGQLILDGRHELSVGAEDGNLDAADMVSERISLEMRTLKSVIRATWRAIHFENKFNKLKADDLESTRNLAEKHDTEMVEHLKKMQSVSEQILAERMLTRLNLAKSLGHAEVEIVEHLHKYALMDTQQEQTNNPLIDQY